MDSYGGNYEAVANGETPPLSMEEARNSPISNVANGNNNQPPVRRRTMQRRSSMNTMYQPPILRQNPLPTPIPAPAPDPVPTADRVTDPEEQDERRGSMTMTEEKERRASIKAILMDNNIPPVEKRKSIQALMDGRRNSKERRTSLTDMTDALVSSGGNPQCSHDVGKAMEQSRPKCNHYSRKCTIISPCCGAAFGCRICHDECPFLPPPKYGVQKVDTRPLFENKKRQNRSVSLPSSWTNMPKSKQHEINRFEIREVICRECFTRQSSKTNQCINCHAEFGEYHCEICNLWMEGKEEPYHCYDCGFCRVGGRDNFKHCNDCGMCIDVKLFNDHNCKSGKYMSNCPVCQEDLFSSRKATHEMPCGHTIHWHCYQEFSKHDSRCPVCKKTSETPENMSQTWSAIALSIAMQPVPVELAKVVDIKCNDCENDHKNLRWHFLGTQCRSCNSFNTSIEKISLTGRQAALFSDQMDAFRSQSRGGRLPMSLSSVGEILPGYHPMESSTSISSQSSMSASTNPASRPNGSSYSTSQNDGMVVNVRSFPSRRMSSLEDDEVSEEDR